MLADADETAFFAAAQYEDGRRLADAFDVSTLERIRHALGPRAPPEAQFERLKEWFGFYAIPQYDGVGMGDAQRAVTIIGSRASTRQERMTNRALGALCWGQSGDLPFCSVFRQTSLYGGRNRLQVAV